jgi:hypothetical protein
VRCLNTVTSHTVSCGSKGARAYSRSMKENREETWAISLVVKSTSPDES